MRNPTRMVLVRHADPDRQAHGRCYGALDISLSPSGRRHARLLAQRLGHIPVSAVYSSPLERAVDTAAPIATAHNLITTFDDRLREIDFGEFEGCTYVEIEQGYPALYRQWMESPTHVRFPGGEDYTTLRLRAVAAMEAIRDRHQGATVVVVSHDGVLRAMLADCLSMPNDAIFRLDQGYGSTSIVDWFDQTPLVRLVNGQMDTVLLATAWAGERLGRWRR
jgi:alpha-ribazole phosphatase